MTISLLTDGQRPMKECFKCKKLLPLSEFYRHPMMGDGHLGKCKRCTKLDVRKNYADNIDKKREYDRMRNKDPERQRRITASTNKDPLKVWARKATHSALNWGVLVRQPCEVCGDEKSDAHHEDYRYPLSVKWLCRKHHMEAHHPIEDVA